MSAPGPELPPRSKPGSKPKTDGAAPPPVPAPRVSTLAKSFQGNSSAPPSPSSSKPPPVPLSRPPSRPPSLPPDRLASTSSAKSDTPPPARPSRRSATASTSSSINETRAEQGNVLMEAGGEGFGACLQNCYDTINKRHEDELLALESLRNHVFSRARFDKDYSENLAKTNLKATRKMNSISNKSSAIMQAWLVFLEMSEALQRQISNGAAQMSGVLLHTVDQLIRDKRGAKAAFDQERSRMENEQNSSCKAAQELRRAYQGYLKLTETNKKKLLSSLAKDPPRPADQERYRKKFVHNSEKLHSCHNDYSLALVNANIHIDHYRHTLLPFCLDTLQQRMELQITQWKDALMNYAITLDFTKVYEEQFKQLYNSLRQVEQDQEYVEFIKENKKEQLPVEYYEFDVCLLTEPSAPETEPGKIVVNNLTYQNMKTRLTTLENEMDQHTKKIEEKQNELKDLMSSSEDMVAMPTSPTKDGQLKLPKHVQEAKIKSLLKELDCLVSRKQDQISLIKGAVGNINEEDVVLFHELGEGVDLKDLETAQSLNTSATGGTTKKRGMSLSSGLKIKTLSRGIRKIGGKIGRTTDRIASSLSSDKNESVSEAPSEDFLDDDDNDSVGYDEPPEIPVEEEEWYYGDIERRVAESKCKNNGDYIVRYSERQAKYVLTCNWNGNGKHFVIQQIVDENGQKMYRFESKSFPTIRALLEYHAETGTAVTKASQAVILKPVPKHDKWSLSHRDINIGKKIGKGAFGDVFEAHLNNQLVAVKSCRSSDLTDMDKFMAEADILKQYNHPNVVRLLGVCADEDPVYIVMEFMPGGALLDFLRKKGSQQTKKKLCSMCVDASRGMEYLESMKCIHRDLAARNCLVGEDDTIKISDFGMSREDEGGIYIVSSGTRQIPIKWTAPEALNYGKYSSPSDVWSFGILLWEVYSCGSAPYPGMSNHDARSQIEVGYRMSPPTDCPQEVYGVMQQCWQYDPEERPTFSEILEMLTKARDAIKT